MVEVALESVLLVVLLVAVPERLVAVPERLLARELALPGGYNNDCVMYFGISILPQGVATN